MAKTSKLHRNRQRAVVVDRYAQRRAELKAIMVKPSSTEVEKAAARDELNKQPRDASATRLRNRDAIDGRPRGFLRKFGLSRLRFRDMAHRGELPGVTKSSW